LDERRRKIWLSRKKLAEWPEWKEAESIIEKTRRKKALQGERKRKAWDYRSEYSEGSQKDISVHGAAEGKTTACDGLVFTRALAGKKVCVVQFLKAAVSQDVLAAREMF